MRHILFAIIATAALCCGIFTSCIDDDFTTSTSDRLAFSVDTLSFDTIFTGTGTPTARLLVFNRAKKSIRISEIRMKDDNSCFRMNVDGQSGDIFHDVEIRGEDSIYMFVECLLPETSGDKPYLREDAIEFVTNGNRQEVVLQAYGRNVTRLRAQRVERDMTLTPDRPYVVFDSLVVAPGATLTVEPGTQLLFHDKASMRVYGRLEAKGTAEKKIQMRGDRLDDVLPDVGYDILAGQWKGVSFAPESFGNVMEYVDMRSTSDGLRVDSCGNLSQRKLLLVNSWLHNSQNNVLRSEHAWIDALGCCFSEAADNVVSLTGGRHLFTQCTFSNYYLFSYTGQPILGLYNVTAEEVEASGMPAMQARFENGIVYGMTPDINVGDLTDTQVFMYNMLFKSQGDNDDHFLNCIWDADPLFLTVRNDYYFNYHVQPDSPALDAGNPQFVTPECRYDMDGVDRLAASPFPTLGAYARPEEPAAPAN